MHSFNKDFLEYLLRTDSGFGICIKETEFDKVSLLKAHK